VSLYIPTARCGVASTQQNPIRFKNALRQAEERLLACGVRPLETRAILEPAAHLLQHTDFWRRQSDGLAVFLSSDTSRCRFYCLPLAFDELVVVTNRLHLKPLLPLLNGDGQFYVLALSQNDVRLLQCTRYSVTPVELPDIPTSLDEALQRENSPAHVQFYTCTQGRGTVARTALLHGYGIGNEDHKTHLLRYFQQIDRGLHALLRNAQAPLVCAGVDYLLPIYREANTYAGLMDTGIPGNPEGCTAEALHAQAWAIVQPIFAQAQVEARARYQRYAGTGQALNDVPAIIAAACHGRVDVLFVAVGVQQWGTVNTDTGVCQIHQEAAPGAADLLDIAAIQTFVNGGTVYAVAPDDVPGGAPLAAVLRYCY
jgi:hypothetical protein